MKLPIALTLSLLTPAVALAIDPPANVILGGDLLHWTANDDATGYNIFKNGQWFNTTFITEYIVTEAGEYSVSSFSNDQYSPQSTRVRYTIEELNEVVPPAPEPTPLELTPIVGRHLSTATCATPIDRYSRNCTASCPLGTVVIGGSCSTPYTLKRDLCGTGINGGCEEYGYREPMAGSGLVGGQVAGDGYLCTAYFDKAAQQVSGSMDVQAVCLSNVVTNQ